MRAKDLRGGSGRGRFVVTGAAGFIGSHLVDRLLDLGHWVVGLDNFSGFYSRGLKETNLAAARRVERFLFVEGDVAGVDLVGLLADADGVFHLAGQPGVRESWGRGFDAYLDANVRTTHRLLESLVVSGVPTVVASSSSVYRGDEVRPLSEDDVPAPRSPYGLSKLAAEELIAVYRREYGLPVVCLRYFTVFGPRQRPDMAIQRFVAAALRGLPILVYGDGDQSRDFTYVDDVVDATIAALDGASPVYNVGGGSPASVREVVALVGELTGRRLIVDSRRSAPGEALHTWADCSRARDEFGWQPKTGLAEGVRRQLAHESRVPTRKSDEASLAV